MQWLLVIILIAVCYFFVLARLRRNSCRGREGFEEKVLLDELDLGDAGEPTIRDFLVEKAPMFLQDQLEIFRETRTIYERIIRTAAGLLAADEGVRTANKAALQPFVEPAIAAISRDAGETPRFCSKDQLNAVLDSPASAGLDRLYECLPSTPGKYLLLLSYAARLLKKQMDGAAGLGLGDAPELPVGSETDMLAGSGSAPTTSKRVQEGWRDSRVSDAFVSAYALQTPSRVAGKQGGSDTSDLRTQIPNSSFDNQLESWKQAFDPESTKRIKQYIRYCNNIYKKLDTINKEAESGELLMRIGKTNPAIAATATAMAAATASGSSNLPAMNLPF